MLTEKIKQLDEELDGEISQAIKDSKFKPLIKNGVWIGFFTFKEHFDENNRRCVFIRNMYVEPQYRSRENFLFLRDFFRKLYSNDFRFVFWHSQKKNRYFYAK